MQFNLYNFSRSEIFTFLLRLQLITRSINIVYCGTGKRSYSAVHMGWRMGFWSPGIFHFGSDEVLDSFKAILGCRPPRIDVRYFSRLFRFLRKLIFCCWISIPYILSLNSFRCPERNKLYLISQGWKKD